MKRSRVEQRLAIAWVLMGFTSMIGQVVLMRELLVAFYGNEASMGIILACWLFWVGVGSLLVGRLVQKIRNKLRVFVLNQLFLVLFLPLSIVLARVSKLALGVSPGEIIGLFPMVYISFLLLAPLCLVLGFLFALSCRLFPPDAQRAAAHIGRIYVYEAVGATLGGALFSYLLIRFAHPFQIAWLVSTLNLLSALSIALCRAYFKRKALALVLMLMLAADLLLGLKGVDSIQRLSIGWQWPGFEVLSSKDSVYGNVTVNERGSQRNFFENGLLMFASPDRFSSEESVHFALLEHPSPRRVLLIGGGVSGSLAEVLKHPVDRVTYVELDPLIIVMANRYLSREELRLEGPRVTVHHLDGRLYVKRTTQRYDVIIVNLPEPFTAQLNRFYTVEFYREAKRILADEGIISFRITSAENYISADLQQLLASFNRTLSQVFAEVKILPGNTNVFLACLKKGVLTYDPDLLLDRLRERSIETEFIREYYLPFRLVGDRVDYLNDRIAEARNVRVNTDFYPISYFYDMVQWTTHFRSPLPSIVRSFAGLTPGRILVPFGALTLLLFFWAFRSALLRRAALLVAVGTTGALEIIFEVVLLVAFQVLYGFVYSRVGIILMGFMVGLTLGGGWMTRRIERREISYLSFLKIQGALCVYPLLLIVIFKGLSELSRHTAVFLSTEILFPLLIGAGGFLGGVQFPLANKLCIKRTGRLGHAGAITYGIDVLGSSLGALTAGSLLIPVLGIWNTCIVLSSLSLFALILLLPEALLPRRGTG